MDCVVNGASNAVRNNYWRESIPKSSKVIFNNIVNLLLVDCFIYVCAS